jgi:hypothetical protein
MAFIPVLNCIQARLIWQEDNGAVAQNVFWHATVSAPTLADMEAIGATWGELMTEAGLVPTITNNWALSSVAMRAMNEEEGAQLTYASGMPISGTSTETAVPDQVAYTVTWSTGLSGRSARGRTYMLGLPISAVENRNKLSVSARNNFNNAWGIVLDAFETEGHALQVVSFQEGGVPRSAGRKLPILSQNVRFPIATRRSRLS